MQQSIVYVNVSLNEDDKTPRITISIGDNVTSYSILDNKEDNIPCPIFVSCDENEEYDFNQPESAEEISDSNILCGNHVIKEEDTKPDADPLFTSDEYLYECCNEVPFPSASSEDFSTIAQSDFCYRSIKQESTVFQQGTIKTESKEEVSIQQLPASSFANAKIERGEKDKNQQLSLPKEEKEDYKKYFAVGESLNCSVNSGRYVRKKVRMCDHCGMWFARRRSLVKHIKIHTGDRPFRCDKCGKCFTQWPYLRNHSLIHSDHSKRFKCKQCPKMFLHSKSLTNHIKIHSGDRRQFICKECNKVFLTRYGLKLHFRIHSGERPFTCCQCDASFIQKYNLIQHIKVHTDDKIFKCEICPKKFSKSTELEIHHLVHEEEKPFKCNSCNKTFSRISNLRRHNKSRIHLRIHPHKTDRR